MEAGTERLLFRYVTYRNYFQALAVVVQESGVDNDICRGTYNSLLKSPGYSKLKDKSSTANIDRLAQLLRNSWSAEISVMEALQNSNGIRASIALPWSFVQMYYGLHDLFDGWFAIQGATNELSKSHKGFLRRYLQFAKDRNCLPQPWSTYYGGPSQTAFGLEFDPNKVVDHKSWTGPSDAPERVVQFLRTTHERSAKEAWSTKDKQDKRTQGIFKTAIPETTIMDCVYRLRIGSNYADIDPYLYNVREREIVDEIGDHIACFYSATMMIGEGLVAKSIGAEKYKEIVSTFVKWVGADTADYVCRRRKLILDGADM